MTTDLRVIPDYTKTTVLEEFRDFANQARSSLMRLRDEVVSDLKQSVGMKKLKTDLASVVKEFDFKLRTKANKVDAVEEALCEYYHSDDLASFVRKTQISKSFIEDIVASKLGR